MKKPAIVIILIIIFSFSSALFVWWYDTRSELGLSMPQSQDQVEQADNLAKYEFAQLKKRTPQPSEINIDSALNDEASYTSSIFSYQSEGKKITGLLNIPQEIEATDSAELEATDSSVLAAGKAINPPYPVIVMIRGYVDPQMYEIGVGTSRAGEYFARHGFITLAPDFLGYGGSDDPPDNVWAERFLRPIAVVDLLASIKNIPEADTDHIFIWGHSNGGMIALSVLALTGGEYPTSLWAPVSQSFPYDILYYTDEFEDRGKALRASLAEFEATHDVDKYSFRNYLDWIKAPIQVHQGTEDDYIPLDWSTNLVQDLKALDLPIKYYTYKGADHNMVGSWDLVMERDLAYFQSFITRDHIDD